MHNIRMVIADFGGVATFAQLRAVGIPDRAIQRAARSGDITRVRRGWYAVEGAHPLLISAARVGGHLGCISGCTFHGLWEPWDAQLHVSVPNRARHLKDPTTGAAITGSTPAVMLHWNGPPLRSATPMPLFECLVQVFRCQQAEIAFVILESALRLGRLDAKGQQLLASRLPSHRELILAAGPLADSGTESLFCYRMARIGIRMQSQVEIPGVGRVDFLIGDRLVIEIDSETHHGERAKRLRDLRRDATLAGLGYIYLRFDYQMIIQEWELVASTVFAVMSRSGHLARR